MIRSGNIGCFCADEVLYCPFVGNHPPWLYIVRNHCLTKCDCGANTKRRQISLGLSDGLDLSVPPWDVKEDGPNPFASFSMTEDTCTSCLMSGSSVLPRDGGGNCSCVNSSSITPRDGERKGHTSMLDDSRKEDI